MSQLRKWCVVLLLVFSLGTPWAWLQSVAWVSMLVTNACETTFVHAVEMTFDGQHPCALCQAVKQGQETERKDSKLKPPEKLTLCLSPQIPALIAPPPTDTHFAPGAHLTSVLDDPPHPPPRAA